MKVLVACGSPYSRLNDVFSILSASGIGEPQRPERRAGLTIDSWHSRLFGGRSVARPTQAITPGKAWEQAAGEIFLANWEQPLWGWADTLSGWVLDFWRDFDPGVRLVLVSSRPERALARALADAASGPIQSATVVAEWMAYEREMLRFYNRNRERSVLIDGDRAAAQPQEFLEAVGRQFDMTLNTAAVLDATNCESADGLFHLLAGQILRSFPDAAAIACEGESSLTWVCDGNADQAREDVNGPTMLDRSVGELRELIEQRELATRFRSAHDQLLAQLHQVQEALECEALDKAEKTKALSAEIDLQRKIAIEAQQNLDLFQQNSKVSEKALKQSHDELKQENELLLLQLHQVQEELERYFLQWRELQKNEQTHVARWNRFLERYPDYCDWTRIDLLSREPVDAELAIRWRIHDLVVGARSLPELEVSAMIRGGCPALVLHAGANGEGPLLRWPVQGGEKSQLLIQPSGGEGDQEQRWNSLQDLTSSDWHLVRSLCSVLADFQLMGAGGADNAGQADGSFWHLQLTAVRQQLDAMPLTWRYDRVSVKREQVNPDYEHLWLVLENAEFGNRHWREFEVRLSAALVNASNFSLHPKLEFPRAASGEKQFENWYAESQDDYGDKFELRFALEGRVMDMGVWNRLSDRDQGQLLALAFSMPDILADMARAGTVITRPWRDWRRLMRGILNVFLQCAPQLNPPQPAIEADARVEPLTAMPTPKKRVSARQRKKRA